MLIMDQFLFASKYKLVIIYILLLTGEQSTSYEGRVISVKWGDYTKRIGIDGNADGIKEAIKSAFRLRTRRAFWLEDEDNIVRTLDRDMPLGNYTLHVDEGSYLTFCCVFLFFSVSFRLSRVIFLTYALYW